MSRAEKTRDAAAAWVLRRDGGDWSDRDQAALDAWLAESDGNKAAYWRLDHSWREADRIGSLGIASTAPVRSIQARRLWRPVAMAASIALAVGIGAIRVAEDDAATGSRAAPFATPLGAHRTIPLADGTDVELNTRSAIRASVTKAERRVWLDRGEAFFQVAHDPDHPFVIFAGAKRITVLGTKFSVRRDGARTTVSVLEGRVRIDDAGSPMDASANSTTITGGTLAVSDGASTIVTQGSRSRVEDALAWRSGMLKFDHVPLSDVAREFNRYNRRQIIVNDGAAAAIPIGGVFQASNIDAFARLLRDAYHLKITENSGQILISS
jgi:transmembrane sensor